MQFSQITLENSIISNSSTPLDLQSPFSFFDFLKQFNAEYTPREYNQFYTDYLKEWYARQRNKAVDSDQFVRDSYSSFLKEISLTYTSVEEKRFLQSLDFTNPLHLDIALPFYAEKIKDICLLIRSKRGKAPLHVEYVKHRGTEHGITRYIYNSIVDYATNLGSAQVNVANIDIFKYHLDIDIEQYIDEFSDYFDDTRENSRQFFTANTNPLEDFFNKKYIDVKVFLAPFKNFTINYNLSSSCLAFEETSQQSSLLKKLYAKYLGSDMYFLSSNSSGTQTVSGIWVKADNCGANYLNRSTPSTATIPVHNLKSIRHIGKFFTPDHLGLLQFKGDHDFVIDTSKLSPGKTYLFPDPYLYGQENLKDYPLIIINNESKSIPYQGYRSQSFTHFPFDRALYEWKTDIYGNEYGAFIENDNIFDTPIPTSSGECLTITGGEFFEETGSIYNFTDALTSYTDGFQQQSPLTLYFREFLPLTECDIPQLTDYELEYDGGLLANYNLTLLPDPILADSDSFPSSAEYYYEALVDGGISNLSPLTRATLALSGNLTLSLNYLLSSEAQLVDGGKFFNYTQYQTSPLSSVGTTIINTLSTFAPLTISEKRQSDKQCWFWNCVTNQYQPLTAAIAPIVTKYSQSLRNSLSSIKSIDTIYDNLIITTDSYQFWDKIVFDNEIVTPRTSNGYFSYSSNDVVFAPFFRESDNKIFFTKLTLGEYNNKFWYTPYMYEFDITTGASKNILTLTQSVSNAVAISQIVPFKFITPGGLTYNSRNNIFKLSFTGYDLNQMSYVIDYELSYRDTMQIRNSFVFLPTTTNQYETFDHVYLNNFTLFNSNSSTITRNVSAGEIVFA